MTERLEQAVTAFTEALKEITRERVPLDWAGMKLNLGLALTVLGARESGTERLVQAVAAYTEALNECTRATSPRRWLGFAERLDRAVHTGEGITDRNQTIRGFDSGFWGLILLSFRLPVPPRFSVSLLVSVLYL